MRLTQKSMVKECDGEGGVGCGCRKKRADRGGFFCLVAQHSQIRRSGYVSLFPGNKFREREYKIYYEEGRREPFDKSRFLLWVLSQDVANVMVENGRAKNFWGDCSKIAKGRGGLASAHRTQRVHGPCRLPLRMYLPWRIAPVGTSNFYQSDRWLAHLFVFEFDLFACLHSPRSHRRSMDFPADQHSLAYQEARRE